MASTQAAEFAVRKGDDDSKGGNQQSEPWTILAAKNPQKGWTQYDPRTMRKPALNSDTKHIKVLSYNVNGLKRILESDGDALTRLAQREDFDVLCLQETKLQEKDVGEIKSTLLQGYEHSFYSCCVTKAGYSGTAVISRIKPLSVRYGLGVPEHDEEGRLVTLEFDTFYLIGGYIPNAGTTDLKRLIYRVTKWDPCLGKYMKELEKVKPVILTGDLNCAYEDIDVHHPKGMLRKAGFTYEERQSFKQQFLKKGFVDTFRNQHPNVIGYTFWGWNGGRETNKGWRLDYFLVSESILSKVYDSYILPDVDGSDHSPIALILTL